MPDYGDGACNTMFVKGKTTVQRFWQDKAIASEFKAGVSLHSHTQHSEESLELVPKYVGRIPVFRRTMGTTIDFHRGFWTPPLTPRQAYRLEEKQIQRQFNLPALVSLTDHDSMEANTVLQMLDRFRETPLSTEWTVPFASTFFHLGVHNLPAMEADSIMHELRRYTASPEPAELARLLQKLSECPQVLVVLNHPLWDESGIGDAAHWAVFCDLLDQHGRYVHALEVNGLRPARENARVVAIGNEHGIPVVAGGDRHGREPNAVVNLSRGTSFAEFVSEIRTERWSHIVYMPQYREMLGVRTVRMVVDALREYPAHVHARRTWQERVFYRETPDAEAVPLCSICPNGQMPTLLRLVDATIRLSQWSWTKPAMRLLLGTVNRTGRLAEVAARSFSSSR